MRKNDMPALQRIVQMGRKVIPRGWSPFLRLISNIYPSAKMYRAVLDNGETIFLDLSQNMCHGYFYFGGLKHEQFTYHLLKKILKPGDTFIDVGANIGYFTMIAGRLVGKEGIVHAFEPMPEAVKILKKNIECLSNIELHETAVSNKQGTSTFSVNKFGDTSSLGANPLAQRKIQVHLNTLDSVLENENRIDVVKIDVEGHELEVLQGASRMIDKCTPLLYFEFINAYMSQRYMEFDDYKTLLGPHGYALSWVNPDYPHGSLTTDEPSSYIIGIPTNDQSKDRWSNLF